MQTENREKIKSTDGNVIPINGSVNYSSLHVDNVSESEEGEWDKISIWKVDLRLFNTEKRYIPIDKQDKYKEHHIYHSQIMKHKDKIRNKVKEKWEIIRQRVDL